jgi:YesN/AraC family two-component response regulator
MELVHNHYIEEREVAYYADKLCISPRYLSSVVRSVRIDVTPKAIIDSFVVLEIKALLQSTNLSIQEIADRLHFPDQSFFGRYFKKHTGLMPSRYRAENKWVEK